MILPSRHSRFWVVVAAVSFLVLAGFYALHPPEGFQAYGATRAGLAYGVLASLLVLGLLTFGRRKRRRQSTWGTVEGWLQAHIYLGLLSVAVVLFHAGFRFQDKVATAALLVLLILAVSGIVGARLYAVVPRRLTHLESDMTMEDVVAEIEHLARAMRQIAAPRSELFKTTAEELLADKETDRQVVLGGLDEDEHDDLSELFVLDQERRALDVHLRQRRRCQRLLEGWLYVHVPFSALLVFLVVVHVIAVFYFGGL